MENVPEGVAVVTYALAMPAALRHQTIFGVLDVLPAGYAMLLINDHDPKPLRYQLDAEQPDTFSWNNVEEGPERFVVKITRKS